jgi:malonate transporter and related proteins
LILTVLSIVIPVFALMGLGYLAARTRYLPDGTGAALAQFAFKIAIPAMLFRAIVNAGTMSASPWQLLAAYFIATLCLWTFASLVAAFVLQRPAEDHPVIAMGSTFGNTVMLGIPIALTAFGPEATAPLALLIAIETPLLWVIGTLHMEGAKRGRNISLSAFGDVARDLATNTIILAMLLGLLGRATGLVIPAVPDKILVLLGQAGVPVALFALGMALTNFRAGGESRTVGFLMLFKLALLPTFVYLLTAHVFALPPLWIAIAVLHAAMPVGANPFLFAQHYGRSAATISAAILVSTLTAVLTVSALLVFLLGMLGR